MVGHHEGVVRDCSRSSLGLRHASNTPSCAADKGNSTLSLCRSDIANEIASSIWRSHCIKTYMKQGWPAKGSNSEEVGGDIQGGNREPCSLEASKRMIFSRVVNSRSERGSVRAFAFFTDPLIYFCTFSLDSPSGEATSLVWPLMMRTSVQHTLRTILSLCGYMRVYKHHLVSHRLYESRCS